VVRYQVLIAVLLRIQVFWDMVKFCWVCGHPTLQRNKCLHIQGQRVILIGLPTIMRQRQCVPSKHQEPLTLWHSVTINAIQSPS